MKYARSRQGEAYTEEGGRVHSNLSRHDGGFRSWWTPQAERSWRYRSGAQFPRPGRLNPFLESLLYTVERSAQGFSAVEQCSLRSVPSAVWIVTEE